MSPCEILGVFDVLIGILGVLVGVVGVLVGISLLLFITFLNL